MGEKETMTGEQLARTSGHATEGPGAASNVARMATPGSGGEDPPGGEPPGSASTIIKSKSNITNN